MRTPGKLTPAEAEAIALRRNQRTPGTIEVSEADYLRLVEDRRALLTALQLAEPHLSGTICNLVRAAIKLAECDD